MTVYCSLLSCSRILIDTGEADKPDYVSLLKETLTALNAQIGRVIITHWHHDHLGGVQGVASLCHGNANYTVYHRLLCTV